MIIDIETIKAELIALKDKAILLTKMRPNDFEEYNNLRMEYDLIQDNIRAINFQLELNNIYKQVEELEKETTPAV
ncbi:MAG: hypothetical protein GW761_00135 [Leptospira sp.]|nr:hypothetical protein [Leptospira sp.]